MDKIWITFFLCFSLVISHGQDDLGNSDIKELTVRFGFSKTKTKDGRISARTFKAWSPKYDIAYTKINDKRISEIRFQFSMIKNDKIGLLGMNSIHPNVNYSYQRKVSEGVWIGGFLESNTLLNFPSTKSGLFTNNPISYTISEAIGPRITYVRNWNHDDTPKYQIRTSAQSSLLAYVIQPAWGHPYPSQFLKEGTFNPQRNGMAWPLVKSGKLVSVKKHRSFRVELGFYYLLNEKFRIGVDLQSDFNYSNASGKAVSIVSNDIFVGASFIH